MEGAGPKPTRKCVQCGLESDKLSLFVKDKGSKYGRRNNCHTCYQATTKSHPEYRKWQTDYQVQKRYGVDVDTYLERMAAQKSCQVCGSGQELCYDHCHATMTFRGVLCRACNRSIGQLGDNADSLQKAVDYLRKAEEDAGKHVGDGLQ